MNFNINDLDKEWFLRAAEAEEGCEDFGAGAEVVDVAGYLRSFGPVDNSVRESFAAATEALLKDLAPCRTWPETVKERLVQEVLGFAHRAALSRLREAQEAA